MATESVLKGVGSAVQSEAERGRFTMRAPGPRLKALLHALQDCSGRAPPGPRESPRQSLKATVVPQFEKPRRHAPLSVGRLLEPGAQ